MAAGQQPPVTSKKLYKNLDFTNTMVSNILHDLLFSQNELLNSADD
jgi:hypothetical protein